MTIIRNKIILYIEWIMAFRDVLPSRKPCCTKRRVTILEVFSCSNQSLDYLSTVWLWIPAVNTSKIHYFGAQIGYVDRPVAMNRYDALEPAYCFEFIGMLGAYGIPADISDHGLRERGLGNCLFPVSRSGTSWGIGLGEEPKSFPACRKRLEIDDFSSIIGALTPERS